MASLLHVKLAGMGGAKRFERSVAGGQRSCRKDSALFLEGAGESPCDEEGRFKGSKRRAESVVAVVVALRAASAYTSKGGFGAHVSRLRSVSLGVLGSTAVSSRAPPPSGCQAGAGSSWWGTAAGL